MFCSKVQKTISYVVFVVYFLLLIWLILFKFSTSFHDLTHIRNINLIPFGGSAVINGKISFREILWNILVFIPWEYTFVFLNRTGHLQKGSALFFA